MRVEHIKYLERKVPIREAELLGRELMADADC
jgi:hypothetical protein